MSLILRRSGDYKAFQISPDDTNYMVCIADPVADGDAGIGFTAIVEVYRQGGKTPPNAIAMPMRCSMSCRVRARLTVMEPRSRCAREIPLLSRLAPSMWLKTPARASSTP